MENQKQNYLVVKHNDLIEARYKLTLCEQKLVLNVAMMIKRDDVDFYEYKISVSDFMDMMGVTGKKYHTLIRQVSKTLLKKPLVIPLENGNEIYCNWFSSITYLRGEGRVVFCFDPKLKPYLLQFQERFTKYNIMTVMQFRSGFSIRIYELTKQYLSKRERIIELFLLKKILGVEGRYPLFSDFRKKVLNPAMKEINSQSDIIIDYKPSRECRKITAIRFTIKPNPKPCRDTVGQVPQCPTNRIEKPAKASVPNKSIKPASPDEKAFLDQVASHGTDLSLARQAINDHGLTGVNEILTAALARHQAKPKRDFAAYLAQSFRNGWGLKSPEKRKQEQAKAERIAARAVKFEKNLAEKKKREQAIKAEQESEKVQIQAEWNRLDALVELLPPDRYDALKAHVSDKKKLNPDLLRTRMRKAVESFLLLDSDSRDPGPKPSYGDPVGARASLLPPLESTQENLTLYS